MPKRRILSLVISSTLLISYPALAQESLIEGLSGRFLPESRFTWSSGSRLDGSEKYEGFQMVLGDFRLRAETFNIAPEGSGFLISGTNLIANSLSEDEEISFQSPEFSLLFGPEHLRMMTSGEIPRDFCVLGPQPSHIEFKSGSLIHKIPAKPRQRPIQTRWNISDLNLSQKANMLPDGCEISFDLSMKGYDEIRSDGSGVRFGSYVGSVSMPGGIPTLAAGSVPSVTSKHEIGGFELMGENASPILNFRQASVDIDILSSTTVPLITSLIRSREDAPRLRALRAYDAATRIGMSIRMGMEGSTFRTSNILKPDAIPGLSRANLTNVIGDYEAGLSLGKGNLEVGMKSSLIGLSDTNITFKGRVTELKEGSDPIQSFLDGDFIRSIPPIFLTSLEISQADTGFMRVFEQITGFSLSVYASIFRNENLKTYPEEYQTAIADFITGMTLFFGTSTRGRTSTFSLETPTDLSIGDTLLLLSTRPDLISRAVRTEIGSVEPE